MIQNLIKTSIRLLWRDRFYSLLNMTGLAIGMAAAVFMFLWAGDELTFDHMHPNGERIYRVLTNWKFGEEREYTSSCSAPLAEEARNTVPGIDQIIRTWNLAPQTFLVGPNQSELENVMLAEQGFFQIFPLPLRS